MIIKNYTELVTNENRKLALDIAEAGLLSINTEKVISDSVKLENNVLTVADKTFDLAKFDKIKVVGFGKASCEAAVSLEKILRSKIDEGAVIGLSKTTCDFIETFVGTHPRPSEKNIEAGKKIYEICENSKENDLIIVVVSGGGSALLCYSDEECKESVALYNASLQSGMPIGELNTLRKHASSLKGGGLAQIAYPSTIIGLIFSDVPGTHFENVASGPTYKDDTTILDAQNIIDKNNLEKFKLIETPKEDKYFEKVHNFVLVSNSTAVEAMAKKAGELGLQAEIISTELYDEVDEAINKIFSAQKENTVILAAGEPNLVVKKKGGSGGRNLFMAMRALKMNVIDNDSVFIPLASDGMDNSDAAGAVVDKNTIENIKKLNINLDTYLENYDAYPVFKQSGDMITTGITGSNVSDLMILLNKKS